MNASCHVLEPYLAVSNKNKEVFNNNSICFQEYD